MSNLKDPLIFAVQDIIENSVISNAPTLQFIPVLDTKDIRNMAADTEWPKVTAITRTIEGNDSLIEKVLVVVVYFPLPVKRDQLGQDLAMQVVNEAEDTYGNALMELADWLTGVNTLAPPSGLGPGQPVYNFDLAGNWAIDIAYDNRGDTEREKDKAIHDLVAVSLVVRLAGTRRTFRKQPSDTFKPKLAGVSLDRFRISDK